MVPLRRNTKNLIAGIWPLILIFLFEILILNTILFNPIKLPTDTYYHLSRIANSSSSFFQFLYPQNFKTLGQIGIVSNIFYPSFILQLILNIIPKLGILKIFKIYIFLLTYIASIIVYSILKLKLKKGNWQSIIFSVIWAVAINWGTSGIAGDILAKIGLPLVCIGLMTIEDKGAYKYIVSGILIAMYSHLITALFLAAFTFVYYIVTISLKKSSKKIVNKNFIMTTLFTFLGGMGTILPLLMFSHYNNIKKPNVDFNQFQTWTVSLLDTINLSSKNSIIYIFIAIFILSIIIKYGKISYGVVIALVISIFGTNSIAWERFFINTPLTTIQMPVRIFDFGILMAFCFAIFEFNKIEYPTVGIFITIVVCLLGSSSIYKENFPDLDNNGSMKVATVNEIADYVNNKNDGYGLGNLGAFDANSFKSPYIWRLMNYADYVPKEILDNKESSMLGSDKEGSKLVNHDVVDYKGDIYKTYDYNANNKDISFKMDSKVDNKDIKLPILGYKMTHLDLFINKQKVNYTIVNGQIAINNIKLNKNDKIEVIQRIPKILIISYIIAAVSLLVMFLLKLKY